MSSGLDQTDQTKQTDQEEFVVSSDSESEVEPSLNSDRQGTTNVPPGVPDRPVWRTPLIAGAAAACGCVAIALVNPTDTGVPVCWSRAILGVDCPLCGGLRATNALMRGRFLEAADHNVLVAVALPVVAVVWVLFVVTAVAGRPFRIPKIPRWAIWVLAVLVASFTVLRNTGGPAWVDWLASGNYR